MDAVYLDHNATTPLRAEVIDVMTVALGAAGNASSVHGFGRRQRQSVEAARAAVADMVGARPDGVIFTSGGTEANNLALSGCGRRRVLVSAIEHDSVLQAVADPVHIPVTADGVVDCRALITLLERDDKPALISVMLVNNETGVVQPIADIAEIAHRHDALLHCDAVQAAGRLPLDMATLGADMMTISAHKFGGPQGIGALVLGRDIALRALLRGGGQERGHRAGTENTAAIAGFGEAARLAKRDAADRPAHDGLRDKLERALRAAMPDAVIFGDTAPRVGNTSCFALPGLPSETQVVALDLAGLAVSAGSACSSGKVQASHVLRAMGVAEDIADCAIRVSFGPGNTPEDVTRLLDALIALRRRVNSRQSAA